MDLRPPPAAVEPPHEADAHDPGTAPGVVGHPAIAPPVISPRQYLWFAGAVIVVAAALHWLGNVLTPFLFGVILAYLGTPIVNRCVRAGLPRTFATLLAITLLLALVLGLFLIVVPLLQAELGMLFQRVPLLSNFYNVRVLPWVEQNLGVTLAFDLATLRDLVSDNAKEASAVGLKILASVGTGGLLLIGVLLNLALVPVVMFYLLRDGRGIIARVDQLVPRRWEPLVRGMAHEIDHVLSEFLHGQMLVMISLATFYVIALSLVGLQFSVPIGIVTGLLVFIPYVGFGIGLLLGMMAALLQWTGWPSFLAVAAVYGIGQLLENYVLLPTLIGHRIGLHPLAVIFSLLAFGQLFGFAGVLLALPVSAILLVALRRLRAAYMASPIYRTR